MKTILITIVGTMLSALCFGQQSSLTGNLTNDLGLPLERAFVVLVDIDSQEYVAGTSTDRNGYFEFESLEEGYYTVKVDHRTFNQPMEVDEIATINYDVLTSVVYVEEEQGALYLDVQPNLEPFEDEIEFATMKIK